MSMGSHGFLNVDLLLYGGLHITKKAIELLSRNEFCDLFGSHLECDFFRIRFNMAGVKALIEPGY